MSEEQGKYGNTWDELAGAISGSSDPAYIQEKKQVEQLSTEWFKQRLGKFTASRMIDVMGRGRGELFGAKAVTYVQELIIERTLSEEGKQIYIEQQMSREFVQTRWGNKYEPEARAEFEKWIGNEVDEVTFKQSPIPYFGGSADFRIPIGNIPGEIKCPYNVLIHQANLDLQLTGIDRKHTYYPQIQAHMINFDAPYCLFVSYDPRRDGAMKLAVIKVERDQPFIDEMLERMAICEAAINANLFDGVPVRVSLNKVA